LNFRGAAGARGEQKRAAKGYHEQPGCCESNEVNRARNFNQAGLNCHAAVASTAVASLDIVPWIEMTRSTFAFLFATLLCVTPSLAQQWPTRPVRIIVPYAPGGSADSLGRLVSAHLSETFKQGFVVENRPGAGGAIGADIAAKAAPDGYTLVVSGIATHAILSSMTKAPYDSIKSFTHIALFGGPPIALAVPADLPPKTMREFLAYAGARAGGVSYGSPGGGTHGHLVGELFQDLTRAPLTHVPYKGAALAMTDLLSGQIQASFTTLASALQHIRVGKLRAIAVTAPQRMPELPDVPTFAELGYKDLTSVTWFSLSGPAGIPAPIVERLNLEVRKALRTPKVLERLRLDAAEPNDLDAAAFTKFVQEEQQRWGRFARSVKTND
jgi:tripartite-type tricarboxylate transporter receptor subunit TctC